MKKKSFPTEPTPLGQLNAMQRNWLTYEFQITEDEQIIPLQPLHTKPDFSFSVSYKILIPQAMPVEPILKITELIQTLYPKCTCEWTTTSTKSMTPGHVIVSLIESL